MLETNLRMVDHAQRTFKVLVADLSLASWISRACAKHQHIFHDRAQIPKLVSSYYYADENVTHRQVPLIYFYDQLIVDFRHFIWQPSNNTLPRDASTRAVVRVTNPRTVPNPQVCHPVWLEKHRRVQQRENEQESRAKRGTADEYFQEMAKEAHERNKSIPSPYEHEDTEQYNFAFESELEQDKKDIIKDTKRLIALIKDKTPSKEYIGHRKRLLDGDDSERAKKDYDEYAIFELEQYIDDIKTNNADKCILGYYEDRALNINNPLVNHTGSTSISMSIPPSDGPSGQDNL
jgi:hypothetical protein